MFADALGQKVYFVDELQNFALVDALVRFLEFGNHLGHEREQLSVGCDEVLVDFAVGDIFVARDCKLNLVVEVIRRHLHGVAALWLGHKLHQNALHRHLLAQADLNRLAHVHLRNFTHTAFLALRSRFLGVT